MDNEWFEQLTDSQKAKLLAMDGNISFEQLAAYCKEEKLPLPDDFLDGVNGDANFNTWCRERDY